MKELDAVGDALEGLLGMEGGGVHPGPGETDAAMKMSALGVLYWLKPIQFFGVLALAHCLLPLPVTFWEPGFSGSGR